MEALKTRIVLFYGVYLKEHLQKKINLSFVISCGYIAVTASNFHWSGECHSNLPIFLLTNSNSIKKDIFVYIGLQNFGSWASQQ